MFMDKSFSQYVTVLQAASMGNGRAGPCVVAIDTLKSDALTPYIRPASYRSTEENDPS